MKTCYYMRQKRLKQRIWPYLKWSLKSKPVSFQWSWRVFIVIFSYAMLWFSAMLLPVQLRVGLFHCSGYFAITCSKLLFCSLTPLISALSFSILDSLARLSDVQAKTYSSILLQFETAIFFYNWRIEVIMNILLGFVCVPAGLSDFAGRGFPAN